MDCLGRVCGSCCYRSTSGKKEDEDRVDVQHKENRREDGRINPSFVENELSIQQETRGIRGKKEDEDRVDVQHKENRREDGRINPYFVENELSIQQETRGDRERTMESATQNQPKVPTPVENETFTCNEREEMQRGPDAFNEILSTLGLTKYHPSRISTLHARTISKAAKEPKLVDLPWMIIQKLFLINFHSRDQVWNLVKGSKIEEKSDGQDDNFSLDKLIAEIQTNNVDNDSTKLNTLDVMVAIFTCCDNMLKQTFAEKLFVCKLAIPFLYPQGPEGNVVMSLWALRTITVQWNYNHKEIREAQVTERAFPIVTFVRLGRPPISKSKLMNDILRDNSHDTFFHHDCNNGTITRRLTDGLAECAWFITSGKENEHLPCTTMFVNLRGDSLLMGKQMGVLQEISSVVFVIVSAYDLTKEENNKACQQLYQRGAKIILLLIIENDKYIRQALETLGNDFLKSASIISSKQKNASALKTVAREHLSRSLKSLTEHRCTTMGKCAQVAEQNGIIVDEYDDKACLEGRKLAENVISHMKGKPIAHCKSELLPLQGEEWLKYCDYKKQQHRTTAKTQKTANQAAILQQQMDCLRKEQVKKGIDGVTPFMKDFMTCFQKTDDVILYFLKWLSMFLDDKSRNNLPDLRKKYHTMWVQLQQAKKNKQEAPKQELKTAQEQVLETAQKQSNMDMNKLIQQVNDAERHLASASLGLENLFRELGQVYEALKESREIKENSKALKTNLPKVAAKLLTMGIPLELIDGDASSVPIAWVKAVLDELGSIIGKKKKLLVISVLGVQSSGKSTLLNTMFGLRFAVSAGRCTRGAYMQLIPVNDSAKLPFSYIVVVDTEGLRAPELGQQKHVHDNELATLVIGLGDVTIINIKGENTSEVKDTLQIAVHAFLRMKLVGIQSEDQRTCIFAHQNVAAVNAEEMMMQGCQKLQEDLDTMVKEAAQSENIASITYFDHIINFDVHKHVWYISDLWEGDPPMAHANPGYSEKVAVAKEHLLGDIIKSKTTYLTASNLSARLEDLWKAILAEDFVFSFRNSLEMKAYTGLQSEYYRLEWELQKCLTRCLLNAEVTLKRSETIKELDESFESLRTDLIAVLTKRVEELKTQLVNYFEKDNLQDIIIHWKQSKLNQLDITFELHKSEGKAQLLSIKDACSVEIKQNQKLAGHEIHIMENAVELAKQFKGKGITEAKLQKEFDSMWTPMVNELALQSTDKELEVEKVMGEVLFERLSSSKPLLEKELKQFPLQTPPTHKFLGGSIRTHDITKEYISLKENIVMAKVKGVASKLSTYFTDPEAQAKEDTVALTKEILQEISTDLRTLSKSNTKFHKSHATDVVYKLVEKLDNFNKAAQTSTKYTFTIPKTYYVKLAVHVSRHCVQEFERVQSKYFEKHGINTKLEAFKNTAWSLFKNTVKQSSEEEIAGDILCTQLKKVIHEAVKKNITPQCIEEVLMEFGMIKYYLIMKIMEDLACKEDFNDFASYIQNAKEFALKWVECYTNEKIFSSQSERDLSRFNEISKNHISKIILCVTTSVQHATKKTNDKTGEGHDKIAFWIKHFCKEVSVSAEIAVQDSSLKIVETRQIGDFTNFQRIILEQMRTNVQVCLENDFNVKTEEEIDWDGIPPSQQILEKIWGCGEQCPFCGEPCADTTVDHFSLQGICHTCVQHRPKGIGGVHWHKDGIFEDVKVSKDQLSTVSCMYSVQCEQLQYRCWKCTRESESEVWHKYSEYKTCLKDWTINPDPTNSLSKYWMWFMAKYQDQLKDWYKLQSPKIPEFWKSITKEEALTELRKDPKNKNDIMK